MQQLNFQTPSKVAAIRMLVAAQELAHWTSQLGHDVEAFLISVTAA
jgi:hypothetical protein